jgi:hypothetical protein
MTLKCALMTKIILTQIQCIILVLFLHWLFILSANLYNFMRDEITMHYFTWKIRKEEITWEPEM